MHVVRQRKRVAGIRSGLLGQPRLRLVLAGTAALAVVGSGAAYGTTTIFGENKVGQEYSNGLQISSDQVLKPLGDRLTTPYGKFMGSTVSPDGRFLVATSNDRSVALQVFDLSTYKLIWRAGTASGVDLRLSDNTVGQEGPVVLAGRRVPLHAERHRHHQVLGEPRRHAGGPHQDRHPDRGRQEGADRRHGVLGGRQDPVRRRQRPEQGGRRSTRPPAWSPAPGTSASPRAR